MIKIIIHYFYEHVGRILSISYTIKLSNNYELRKLFKKSMINY